MLCFLQEEYGIGAVVFAIVAVMEFILRQTFS